MKRVYALVIILLLVMSFTTRAAVGAKGTVEVLYPSHPGIVYFRLKNDICTGSGYFKFALNTEEGRAWYALLLAAANTSKPVIVPAPECPTVTDVDISYVYQVFN